MGRGVANFDGRLAGMSLIGGWGSSCDNEEQNCNRERESRGQTEGEREAGEMRGGGEEGIRLRDKTAGTGCPAGSRSYCALVLPPSHFASRRSGEKLVWLTKCCHRLLTLLLLFIYFFFFLRNQFIWITNKTQQNLFFKRTPWNFAPFCVCGGVFWHYFDLPWHWCRHGGLLEEELPLSAVCFQKEG